MIGLSQWEFPLSLILAALLVAGVLLTASLKKTASVARILGSRWLAAILFLACAVMMAIEGTWGMDLHHHWTFLTVVLVMMCCLGTSLVCSFRNASKSFILSHLGVFVVLLGGFFGAPDFRDVQIVAGKESASHVAYLRSGEEFQLPFELTLEELRTDFHADGVSPRQYSCTLSCGDKMLVTSVNHPCRHKGYSIYLTDFDHQEGKHCVLKLVKDPWQPMVLLGILLLMASAFLQMNGTWRSKFMLPVTLILAAAFAFLSLARINFGTLPPALRSIWFLPHVAVYMLAYSVMAVSLICSIAALFSKKIPADLSSRLLSTSSAMLLLGMLCGAIWAKAAWGDYWNWDAKECWAAATWMLTLAASHIPSGRKNGLGAVVAILISFLAIQMTWYGVDYLPAARESLHNYIQ